MNTIIGNLLYAWIDEKGGEKKTQEPSIELDRTRLRSVLY